MKKRLAMRCRRALSAGAIRREDVFVSTKLWNTNHRPERVKPAFDASRRRLKIDTVDCYLIHTPFAFKPGDELDPRDEHGQVIYDSGVTLIETWQRARAPCGRRSLQVDRLNGCYFGQAARRSLRPRGSSLQSCRLNCILISLNGTCSISVASTGSWSKRAHRWRHDMSPRIVDDPVITKIAQRVHKTPAQVALAWAVQRGTAVLTTSTKPDRIRENFEISTLPEDAMREIRDDITTNVRFNAVVATGVPGFIPRAS